MSETISIILPTYNRRDLLPRAVESALGQSYTDIEILIVDDGSIDGTAELVETWSDQRIRYIPLPHNGGAAHARNVGVSYATGNLIAFLDSDDSWRPSKLEKQMAYWRENPGFSMIYCPFYAHIKDGGGQFPYDTMGILEGSIFVELLLRNTIGTPTMLLKKDCFLECGGFDTTFSSLEDWEFAIRFARKYTIGYVDEVLVDAYYGGDQRLSANKGAYYKGRLKMIALYREQLQAEGYFDKVVLEIFQKAEKEHLLAEVQDMLMLLLRGHETER